MPESTKVRVFISWSGDLAKDTAIALRDWLPLVFDNVIPWASDTDIEAGSRSLDEIHDALRDSTVGIIVVTRENQNAAWLNYEAGALAKTVSPMKSRVIPLLVDIESPAQLTGPMAQFQAKQLTQIGIADVLSVIGGLAGVESSTVDRRLEPHWPSLESAFAAAKDEHAGADVRLPRRSQVDLLEEVLSHVRIIREGQRPQGSRQPTSFTRIAQEIQKEGQRRGLSFKATALRGSNEPGILLREEPSPWGQSGVSEKLVGFAEEMAFAHGVPVHAIVDPRLNPKGEDDPPF